MNDTEMRFDQQMAAQFTNTGCKVPPSVFIIRFWQKCPAKALGVHGADPPVAQLLKDKLKYPFGSQNVY